MNVEYLARQYEITPAVRDEVEEGLGKLTRILGENFKSKVILTNEKHRFIAEITVKRRRGHIVGLAEATDMVTAATRHSSTSRLRHSRATDAAAPPIASPRTRPGKPPSKLRVKPRSPSVRTPRPLFRSWCTSFLPWPAPARHT